MKLRRWIAKSLSRKLLFVLAACLGGASVVFLLLFVSLYQRQIEIERMEAADKVNQLLQVALEDAMLRRDLPGLRGIVRRFGRQPDLSRIMILNVAREVRFASDKSLLGRRLSAADVTACAPDCIGKAAILRPTTRFMIRPGGEEILRSVNPVHNRPPCQTCHGPIAKNPVNGIIVVDYAAGALRHKALLSALALSGSGALVLTLSLLGTGLFLRRVVLRPVSELMRTSEALARGDLEARAAIRGADEIAGLGRTVNHMAERLQGTLSELTGKEEFLQAMIDAIPDGIRVIDQDYAVVRANRAYCRQIGSPMNDILGVPCYRSSHGLDTPCPPTLVTCPMFEFGHSGNLASQAGSFEILRCEHRHVRSDGSELYVEVYAAPLRIESESGTKTWVIEAIRDLSQQIKLSQEQRLSELGQLATGVAHEISNPLSSARLGLQAMLRNLTEERLDSGQMSDYLSTVDREIDKCVAITDRLLKLSMPPSVDLQLVSLTEVVPDIVSLLAYEAEKSGVRIDVDLGPGDLRVLADDGELRQLVLNLIQNGFHAMPNGGELKVSARLRGEQIELRVSDSGVGISAEDMPYIFDPFFSRRADGVAGTGLGLTLSKAIVERYGGRISAHSELGKGSVFVVTLPVPEWAPRDK